MDCDRNACHCRPHAPERDDARCEEHGQAGHNHQVHPSVDGDHTIRRQDQRTTGCHHIQDGKKSTENQGRRIGEVVTPVGYRYRTEDDRNCQRRSNNNSEAGVSQ